MIAQKSNPRLWETSKRKACSQGKLCKHSARKMQWATRYYQANGGRYVGARSKKNKLTQWGKQKWRTSSGKKSKGRLRYLPDKAWNALTPAERRRTNVSKRRGYRQGRQYVKQPSDVARKTRRFRRTDSSRKTRRSRKTPSRQSRRRRRARRTKRTATRGRRQTNRRTKRTATRGDGRRSTSRRRRRQTKRDSRKRPQTTRRRNTTRRTK